MKSAKLSSCRGLSALAIVLGSVAAGSSGSPLASLAAPLTYQARSFDSEERQAKGSIQLNHADGSISLFSLSAVRVNSGGSITAHVVPVASRAQRQRTASESPPGSHERLMREYLVLRAALISDQPPAILRLPAAGQPSIVEGPARRRYMQCARRVLRSSFARIMTAAPTNSARQQLDEERAQFERMPEIPTQDVSLLLKLATVPLPPAAAGELLKSHEAEPRTAGSEELLEHIRLRGRSMGVNVDLRADHTSRIAGLCRLIEVKLVTEVSHDRCAIQAIVDTRDGWPILATVNRTLDAPASTTARQVRFTRLERSAASSARGVNPCNPN